MSSRFRRKGFQSLPEHLFHGFHRIGPGESLLSDDEEGHRVDTVPGGLPLVQDHFVPIQVRIQQGLSGAYPVEAMEQVLRETLKSLPQDPPAQGMQCGPDGCRLG